MADVITNAASAGHRRSIRTSLGNLLIPFSGIALVIVLWQLIVVIFKVPPFLVPAPTDVVVAIGQNWNLLMANLWPTALEALFGFLLGNIVAIAIAVSFVYSNLLNRAFYPASVALRTVPVVAIAPIFVVLLGNGPASKIVIAALISFFPTLVNMVVGLKSLDSQTIELMRVLSARPWEVFFRARWFAALPFLFSALEIAATSAVLGAIVAEWIGSDVGLGHVIIQATYDFRTPLLYAAIAVSSALAIFGVLLVMLAKRLIVRW